MTPQIRELIEKRAYEIWEYNRDNGLQLIFDEGLEDTRERTALDDWKEAEEDIMSRLEHTTIIDLKREFNGYP